MAKKDDAPASGVLECTGEQLAEAFGVTQRRIQQFADAGIVVRVRHGRFDVGASVKKYLEHRQRQNAAPTERTRLLKAQADSAELRARERAGEVIDATQTAEAWATIISNARTKLLALPAKMAQRVATVRSPAEVLETLTDAVNEALEELAGTNVRNDINPGREDARRNRPASGEAMGATAEALDF